MKAVADHDDDVHAPNCNVLSQRRQQQLKGEEFGTWVAEDNRRFVDAVLWIARAGAAWRDLPERLDRWCSKGGWEGVMAALQDEDLDGLPTAAKNSLGFVQAAIYMASLDGASNS